MDKQLRKTKRKDLIQVEKFSNVFWFIDDPTVFNHGVEFEKL